MSKSDNLEKLAVDIEKKLRLVGIIGVEEVIRPGAKLLVHTLQKAKIHTWMLTGDSLERADNAAAKINLIDTRLAREYVLGVAKFKTTGEAKSFLR